MDFITDGLATERMVRILSVVDVYTRECLALEADTSLGSGRVTRVLERLILERGRPENVRSDNGPEFTSRRMLGWARDWKIGHTAPAAPRSQTLTENLQLSMVEKSGAGHLQAREALAAIRLHDEAHRKEILNKPGCSPCDPPAVDPTYFKTFEHFEVMKRAVPDPTTLIRCS